MSRARLKSTMGPVACLLFCACGEPQGRGAYPDVDMTATVAPPVDAAVPVIADLIPSGFDPDGACAVATETAIVDVLPVDIIWMVDNSGSMKAAVAAVTAGLNDFA